MLDSLVSEILINKPFEVYYEKNSSMHHVSVPEYSSKTLCNLFQLIANESQQTLNILRPLLSASLFDGSRVQLVLPPVAEFPTLAIRRKVDHQLDWASYQSSNYFNDTVASTKSGSVSNALDSDLLSLYKNKSWHSFLGLAVRLKKNIVISGGTSTGKTTLLNALLTSIPAHERLIILEDTREVAVPHNNVVRLLASKGDQGIAKVTMQDLVQCCLRLRPDRIICGEIRGKEILDFISACSTGHDGSLTSIHSSSPKMAFMRMVQMYKLNNVPFMTDEAIMRELETVVDIVVQLVRDDKGRRVSSIYYNVE